MGNGTKTSYKERLIGSVKRALNGCFLGILVAEIFRPFAEVLK